MPAMSPDDRVLNKFVAVPPAPRSDWTIADFEILHKLGGGNYGAVYLAAVRDSNFVVAIKKLPLKKIVEFNIVGQLRREIEIAFHTRHKYVLRTYAYFFDETDIYLVLEPCSNGMLYSELNRVKVFPPTTAARYVAQLAEALLYLHQHHILHRDIKPENILLDHNHNIKLADFGWSVHDPDNRRQTACGTPEYFPPEIVSRQPYNMSADLWCLGVFCYEMLVGQTPFVSKEHEQIYRKIHAMQFSIPNTIPSEARDLISNLLVRDGSQRLALHRIVTHPFLMKYYYTPNNITPPTGKRHRDM